jgi:hypothetical protein
VPPEEAKNLHHVALLSARFRLLPDGPLINSIALTHLVGAAALENAGHPGDCEGRGEIRGHIFSDHSNQTATGEKWQ